MAYNQQNAFWDWVRTQQSTNEANQNGEGVDRPAQPDIPGSWPGGPFGYGNSYGPLFGGHWPFPPPSPPPPGHEGAPPPPPPHHGHGPGGHHHHGPPPPPPPEFGAGFPFGGGLFGRPGPHHHGGGLFAGPPRGGWHGRGGRRGRCGRREGRHGDRHGHDTENEGEAQQQQARAFDLSTLLASLASHPLAQPYRQFFENLASQGQQSGETARDDNVEEENTFTPPLDIFTTPTEYVLHVALPGAKKEDVGINWDAEKGVLNIAGVVYRQGDEEFLKMLSKSERRVGVFERAIRLPPVGEGEEGGEKEKEEIDGDRITAKLEDGVLAVRVPKVEREWTDVRKVDIL